MTELEERFYKTFGIRKALISPCTNDKRCVFEEQNCGDCYYAQRYNFYPSITDHILLELLVILSKYEISIGTVHFIMAESIDKLKEAILKDCIELSENIKSDVHKLFEE